MVGVLGVVRLCFLSCRLELTLNARQRKNLPPEDRAHWDDVALKDKQRYMVEKATYTGPWQVPWKRARKDPSAPKRPMSAFLYFAQGRRTKIKSENPDMKNTEISRILGDIWRNASEEERRPYMEKEREEREKYKVAVAEWKEESDAKREADRKAQIEHSSMMMDPQQQPQMFAEPFGAVGGPFVYATFRKLESTDVPLPFSVLESYHLFDRGIAYMAPQTGPYHFPTNGKQPVILGRNGMPVYPVHFVPNQSPQQSQTQRQQSPLNQYSRATHGFEDHGHDTGGPYDYADPEGPPAGE